MGAASSLRVFAKYIDLFDVVYWIGVVGNLAQYLQKVHYHRT